MSITADFFRNRLDQMIDLRHPLAILANRMPWKAIEASLAHLFARQVRAGKKIEDSDLFGATEVIACAGVSKAGRPRLPTCLSVTWGQSRLFCLIKGPSGSLFVCGVC